MPLEAGTWTMNENGAVAKLTISGVDVAGNVTGTLAGVPISGFWNEVSQKLTFFWNPTPDTFGPEKFYAAFLFTDSLRMPGIRGGTVFTLAGFFTAFQTGSATDERLVFGWYAQIGVT